MRECVVVKTSKRKRLTKRYICIDGKQTYSYTVNVWIQFRIQWYFYNVDVFPFALKIYLNKNYVDSFSKQTKVQCDMKPQSSYLGKILSESNKSATNFLSYVLTNLIFTIDLRGLIRTGPSITVRT